MTSLYNRATPSQRRLLKIVEGAVKNTCDAHPENRVYGRFARSVAKRAAGTISAQWPELLAARMPSYRATSDLIERRPARGSASTAAAKGDGSPAKPSPIFRALYTRLGAMAGFARKAGHEGRAAAFADSLRAIAALEAELKPVDLDANQ